MGASPGENRNNLIQQSETDWSNANFFLRKFVSEKKQGL